MSTTGDAMDATDAIDTADAVDALDAMDTVDGFHSIDDILDDIDVDDIDADDDQLDDSSINQECTDLQKFQMDLFATPDGVALYTKLMERQSSDEASSTFDNISGSSLEEETTTTTISECTDFAEMPGDHTLNHNEYISTNKKQPIKHESLSLHSDMVHTEFPQRRYGGRLRPRLAHQMKVVTKESSKLCIIREIQWDPLKQQYKGSFFAGCCQPLPT